MKIIIKTKSKPPSMMYRKTISSLVCVVPHFKTSYRQWPTKSNCPTGTIETFFLPSSSSTVQGGHNTMWKITHLALNKTLSKLDGLPWALQSQTWWLPYELTAACVSLPSHHVDAVSSASCRPLAAVSEAAVIGGGKELIVRPKCIIWRWKWRLL